MKTLLLSLLCLFVWNQHTEALTDQQVTLGQNVTLACEFRLKAVIWFKIKPSVHSKMILRTFGSAKAKYYDEKLRGKYSEGNRSQLVINDVSVDDLGVYYCIKEWALNISDGIRLHTAGAPIDCNENLPQNQILIVIFTLLTAVMFAAIISLLMMNRRLSKNIPKYANGHQISSHHESDRKVVTLQTNGAADPPSQEPWTDDTYLEIQPYTIYETATY